MKKLRIASIEPGEGAAVALLFVTVLLLVAAQTATKAARDALFLAHFSIVSLSYLMMVMAVMAGVGLAVFNRLTRSAPRNHVIIGLHGFIAVTLCAIAFGLRPVYGVAQHPWLPWFLYLWSGIFSLMVLAEFWLLANAMFHARQGKRLFGTIGAGAILGGAVGGFSSAYLARRIGTAPLLFIVAAELVVASVLSHLAWHRRPSLKPESEGPLATPQPTVAPATTDALASTQPPAPVESEHLVEAPLGIALLWRDRYIRLIASLMICTVVCLTLAEWQYKAIVQLHYGTLTDKMTSFFGLLAGILSLFVFTLQICFTSKILKRFGVGACLRLLPAATGLGSLVLLTTLVLPIMPIVPAAVAVLVSDGVRFSIDKSSLEMLYMPIDCRLRDRAKLLIDTVVDRFSGAIAALIWLAMTFTFHIDRPTRIAYPSFLILAIVAVWMWRSQRARHAYIDAFRALLASEPRVPQRKASTATRDRIVSELGAMPSTPYLRTKLLRSFGVVQHDTPLLGLHFAAIEPHLFRETETANQLLTAMIALQEEHGVKLSMLMRVLQKRLDLTLERVARLLALVYPPRDIIAVERALRARSQRLRAAGLELLDELIDGPVKVDLVALLEDYTHMRKPEVDLDVPTALESLLANEDPWVRGLAAWSAGDFASLRARVRAMATSDSNAAVRRAARAGTRGGAGLLSAPARRTVDKKLRSELGR